MLHARIVLAPLALGATALLLLSSGCSHHVAADGPSVERERQMLQVRDADRVVDEHAAHVERLRVRLGLDPRPVSVTLDEAHGTSVYSHPIEDGVSVGEGDGGVPEPGSCEMTCGLAQDMCVSSQTICAVASGHQNDPRFGDTCSWAQESCDDALALCEACTVPVAEDWR